MPRLFSAFSPSGISSFFQICDREANGSLITDLERVGSRGGGFALSKGVLTQVALEGSTEMNIEVFINGKPAPEAETTMNVAESLLGMVRQQCHVVIRHRVDVPIGAGFGTSAAGALGIALALSKAMNIHLTYNEIGRIAHIAEVKSKTGLGTVGGLLVGGCVLVVEPGAPKYGRVDRIPIPPGYFVIAGVFAPCMTKYFLETTKKRFLINKIGQQTLDAILANPSLENFMRASRKFAEETGLATERVVSLMDAAEEAGAIGAAQNMLGESVHALAPYGKLGDIVKSFGSFLPEEKIVIAEVDPQGVRLGGMKNS